MKQIVSIVLLSLFSLAAKAQTLSDAKKYDLVPHQHGQLPSNQMVDPDASYQTPLEEQLAEQKAKEDAQKEADESRKYLDTDYHFFQVMNEPLGEDELDRDYKYEQEHFGDRQIETPEPSARVAAEKTLDKSTAAAPVAKKDPVEDRRRMISLQLAGHAEALKACVKDPDTKDKKIVVAWEIEPAGNVTNTRVRYSDIDKEAQDCVINAVKEWKFGDFMKNQEKNSRIEYTYRFTTPDNKSAVATQNPANRQY